MPHLADFCNQSLVIDIARGVVSSPENMLGCFGVRHDQEAAHGARGKEVHGPALNHPLVQSLEQGSTKQVLDVIWLCISHWDVLPEEVMWVLSGRGEGRLYCRLLLTPFFPHSWLS